jgi:RimJ/RimL family protein N-acetyltransferase
MLLGNKVRLVPVEEKHLDSIMEGWNNPEMRKFLGGYIPNTREAEREWIRSAQESMKERTAFHFAIEKLDDDLFIGTVSIHEIDWLSHTGTVGISIHKPENWNKGYGTEALELFIEFCWTSLNMRRLELSVHEFNERAMKVYEKLGFKECGVFHEKFFINGKYVNTHYMELFNKNRNSN